MKKSDFRVLLVYANTPMEPLMPLGIASLAAALRKEGFGVKLFDTTYYKSGSGGDSQASRTYSLQVRPVDYSRVGVRAIDRAPDEDFYRVVNDYKPSLIGLSCVELTYLQGLRLLKSVKELGVPNIVGGCFATFSPDRVMEDGVVDMVCVGDGEKALVEVSERLSSNKPLDGIHNIWFREGKDVMSPLDVDVVDVASYPVPEFDLFAPERIYRAMGGRLYRMLPVEFSRGCPYACTYCSAPSYAKKFRGAGKWLRHKPVDRLMREIDTYLKSYRVEYLYFVSETFLAMPADYKNEFYERYSEYKIPFWFNTRPETINEYDIGQLEKIGCHRISIGIESGCEEFRRRVLRRNYSNEEVLRAVKTVLGTSVQLSVNNMIGFPDETRDMIFDTIELNRAFRADSHSVSIFQPFRGTELYDQCVSKGYWDGARICSESFATPLLDMPSLSKSEVSGMYRTFNLYVNADKSIWPDIKKAEEMDEEGDRVFHEIANRVFGGEADLSGAEGRVRKTGVIHGS